MRHKLQSHRAGAIYPLLHQQHAHSLHVHVLDEDPYRPSDARCGDALALIHLGHLEERANKLLNMHTQEKTQTFQMKHLYQQSCQDIRQVLDQLASSPW